MKSLRETVARLEREKKELRTQSDKFCDKYLAALKRAETAERQLAERDADLVRVLTLLQWAHDTLYEINLSNYDHDEVCKLNYASVEVILGIAPILGETHGKTPEWWQARTALAGSGDGWRDTCATEGCGRRAFFWFERGGIGSYYCHDCYMRIQSLPASPSTAGGDGA